MMSEQKVGFLKGALVLKVKINILCPPASKTNSSTVSTLDSSLHKWKTNISASGRSDVYHYPPKLSNKYEKRNKLKGCLSKSPAYTYSAGGQKVTSGKVGEKGEAEFCNTCI